MNEKIKKLKDATELAHQYGWRILKDQFDLRAEEIVDDEKFWDCFIRGIYDQHQYKQRKPMNKKPTWEKKFKMIIQDILIASTDLDLYKPKGEIARQILEEEEQRATDFLSAQIQEAEKKGYDEGYDRGYESAKSERHWE